MSADEHPILRHLRSEVEAELLMVQSDPPAEALDLSPTEWLSDPSEVERFRIGLHGLLGAVDALERDPEPEGAAGTAFS
jgi:hypothetical protein